MKDLEALFVISQIVCNRINMLKFPLKVYEYRYAVKNVQKKKK